KRKIMVAATKSVMMISITLSFENFLFSIVHRFWFPSFDQEPQQLHIHINKLLSHLAQFNPYHGLQGNDHKDKTKQVSKQTCISRTVYTDHFDEDIVGPDVENRNGGDKDKIQLGFSKCIHDHSIGLKERHDQRSENNDHQHTFRGQIII